MKVLAIDPGNTESGWCLMDGNYQLIEAGKEKNEDLRTRLQFHTSSLGNDLYGVVIERVASYGMAVGRDVFETCEWIGRFTEIAKIDQRLVEYVYRLEEKQRLCHDSRAKDTNIRKALIARFAKHDVKTGKGTKDNPDYFYGIKADAWMAIAVAVTYLDRICEADFN